jgi:nucleotide sugar dehydrogenase
MTSDTLDERIGTRNATVGVIGLGYVGLPLSVAFTEAGFDVRGFDIDEHRVSRLKQANSYVDDIDDVTLQAALDDGFEPQTDPHVVADCDVYIIAVPTGMDDDEPDMTAVKAASRTVSEQSGPRETLVVVSSTVYPGATQEVVKPIVTDGRSEAQPTHLAMVPERINPGGEYELADIPLVVGANTDGARAAASTLFGTIVADTHPVETTDSAELTKTLENTYRMVNIALVNELVSLAEGLEADVWEAIDAAATKPFGFQPFRPGPGVGGHCIPVDPQFLTWRAEDLGTEVSFIDDAHQINERMPQLVADRFETLLGARGVDMADASVVALGAAYKPNVGDTRKSPALRVINALPNSTEITVVDPHTDPENTARTLVDSTSQVDLEAADAVILLVDHDAFDLDEIGARAEFVFDTRNAMPDEIKATVVTLGSLVETTGNKQRSTRTSVSID